MIIFGLFEKTRMVGHIGSSITRMSDLMHDKDLPPPEFIMDGLFTVTLRRFFDFEKWVDILGNHLSEKRTVIIKAMHYNPTIRKTELEKHIGLSTTAIDYNIDTVKEAGLIEQRDNGIDCLANIL